MTSCIDPNDSTVVEKQPLHQDTENGQASQEVANSADTEHVVLNLLEKHDGTETEKERVQTFAIETNYQNTLDNPYKETTVTLPHLVKKVPEAELTPKPWTSFSQLIFLSYFSMLFCCLMGALANRWAWRAKLQKGKGLYGLAQKWGKRAALLSYCTIVVGAIMITFIVVSALEII